MTSRQSTDLPKLDQELAATDRPKSSKPKCSNDKWNLLAFFACLTLLMVVGAIAVVIAVRSSNSTPLMEENEQSNTDNAAKSLFRHEMEASVRQVSSDPLTLLDPTSPQSRALDWLAFSDTVVTSVDDPNFYQRYALIVFFFATNGDLWSGIDEKWTELVDSHECTYSGIDCDMENNVIVVELSIRNLSGSLPEEVGLLTNLEKFDVFNNALMGSIPESIFGQLTKLSK